MRLFLAALILGVAGIGYACINETILLSAETQPTSSTLFDWGLLEDPVNVAMRDDASQPGKVPTVVRDMIDSARSEITSTLDEFARVNGARQPAEATETDTSVLSDIFPDSVVEQTQHTVEKSEADVPEPDADLPVNVAGVQEDVDTIVKDYSLDEDDKDSRSVSSASVPTESIESTKTNDARADRPQLPPVTVQSEVKSSNATSPPSNVPTTSALKATVRDSVANPVPVSKSESPSSPNSASDGRGKTGLLTAKIAERPRKIGDSGWTIAGKTTNELPVHTRHFGDEGVRTLVIAGLDGRDLVAVRWNDMLADALGRQTDLFPGNEIQVFRAGNPDGLVKTTAANARGVLLNRNFPGRRYQLLPDRSAGSGPVSESETKAVVNVLYTFRPRYVIHLTSTAGPTKVYYNRSAGEVAAELKRKHGIETQPMDMELLAGSIEDFSDGTLDAAVLTLQLGNGQDWQQAWKKHLPLIMTALNARSIATERAAAEEVARSVDGSRIPDAELTAVPARTNRAGYVELPAPPK